VKKMKVAQISRAGGPFEIVEREIPVPGTGQVRVRVLACGICHSDQLVKENLWPGLQYPRVPGHEVIGIIDETGAGVNTWRIGERVGIGWHGGQDNTCAACRRGDFVNCAQERITGFSSDGGYEEYMVTPIEALARVPDGLSAGDAAPLMCAGITTFNALRHSGAGPGDLVAIHGVGGLGHLGIQFAAKFGYRVVAIGRGAGNAPLAAKLGASRYIDSTALNAAEELTKMGGARVILTTAPSAKAMSALFDGLGANGTMVVVGATPEAMEVAPMQLIRGRRSLRGWAAGVAMDSEDTMNFAAASGVRPMIEKFPLDRVNEAYDRMISGKAEFRVVLTISA
jgi:D-arabinose 1-dehydrogenase-like Zn-dependent alcohol dehydrogenase